MYQFYRSRRTRDRRCDRSGRRRSCAPRSNAIFFASRSAAVVLIGPIFRYERPQKGRYRQSHQFGVECFGYARTRSRRRGRLRWPGISCAVVRHRRRDPTSQHASETAKCRPRYRKALLETFSPEFEERSAKIRAGAWNEIRSACSTVKIPPIARWVETAPAFESVLCGACREHFEAVKAYLEVAGDSVLGRSANRARPRLLQTAPSSRLPRISWVRRARSAAAAGTMAWSSSLGGPEVPGGRICASDWSVSARARGPPGGRGNASARGAGDGARNAGSRSPGTDGAGLSPLRWTKPPTPITRSGNCTLT